MTDTLVIPADKWNEIRKKSVVNSKGHIAIDENSFNNIIGNDMATPKKVKGVKIPAKKKVQEKSGKRVKHKPEEELQIKCISWFRETYPDLLIFAVPNGGSRNYYEAVSLKRSGLLAGVSDVIIPIPNKEYHCLFVEMKADIKCKQTDFQKEFERKVTKFGNKYILCYSFEQFVSIVEIYLQGQLINA